MRVKQVSIRASGSSSRARFNIFSEAPHSQSYQKVMKPSWAYETASVWSISTAFCAAAVPAEKFHLMAG